MKRPHAPMKLLLSLLGVSLALLALLPPSTLAGLPQHIFGLHDAEGAAFITKAGKTGWVVQAVKCSDTPGNFQALANAGIGVLVRLNYGFGSDGTIPVSSKYGKFAQDCANYAAKTKGAYAFIVGNEMNLAAERPGNQNGQGGEVITAQLYAQCFAKVRAAIRAAVPNAKVSNGAVGPYNVQTDDWVKYFRDILNLTSAAGQPPDVISLHAYTHAYDPSQITAETFMDPPYQMYHNNFRAYRDFMNVIPSNLKKVPVFITEAAPNAWTDSNKGWIQAAYKEINSWNSNSTRQPIQGMALFRYSSNPSDPPGWGMSNKKQVLADLSAAMQNNYAVRWK